MKTEKEMRHMLDLLTDESKPYEQRLEAYEYLLEDCEPVVDEMVERFAVSEGETGKMLIEILAEYKGNPAVYMGLVSYLYRGEDVALYARLLGKYGDERAIDVLKSFAEEYDLDYNEYMEVRNAVEELRTGRARPRVPPFPLRRHPPPRERGRGGVLRGRG